MSLSPGTRLGPYEISAQIGAGGMGEVYRATDTTLARQVAIKVLPNVFAQDPERLARFEREAKTLAALNHPHIAQIYGLEMSSGVRALVMEFVEGEDLSQRIARGPIPLDDALPVARQMAEALEVAHEQGIVHRDLKPANIKVTPDGVVKVLDFGLAKLTQAPAVATPAHVTESPTITSPAMLTGAGMILGTAAYMSPEQAAGRAADKRSDVWAFGAVLYEMLSGKRAFEGGGVSETLAAVLRGEPDWDALPATTPAPIDKLLRGCLQKDRKERVPDIAVARFEIKDALAMRGASRVRAEGLVAGTEPRPRWRRALPAAAAAVVTGALVGAVMWTFETPLPPPPVTRFAFTLDEGQQFTNAGRQLIAISPDGAQMVYVANRQLHLRSLSDFQARPIPGTENAQGVSNPVFSPDGRSIAFWSAADRTLKTIGVSGGTAVMICPAENPTGMSWGEDGILFGGQGSKGIMRVPANGGQPELLIGVKDGELAYGPRRLPGSEWVLFTIGASPNAEGWDNAQIVVQSSKSGERRTLVSGGSDARYASTGHITYAVGGIIFAVPFDLGRLAVTGKPVPVIEGVRRSIGGGATGVAQYSVSNTGSIVFVSGPVSGSAPQRDLALVDRSGTAQPLKLPPGAYRHPRVSPDGKQLAVDSNDGKGDNVWIYDLSGASAIRRLTFEGQNRFPAWSADSQRVAFQSDREGDRGIFWQRADGAGAVERLTKAEADDSHIPESWAPDGEHLLYNLRQGGPFGATALWVLSLKDRKAIRVEGGESPGDILTGAVFSPDGRWVAYASGEGRASSAVYVQPFPPTGAKYQISRNADTGHHPMWSPDGAELFFTPGEANRLDVVRVTTQPSFTFREAVPVPRRFQNWATMFERPYDITRDGRHIVGLIVTTEVQASSTLAPQIQVVVNWFEELKRLVPR